jgi:aspartate 1-decarboxylase
MNSGIKNEIIADGIHIATIIDPSLSSEGLTFLTEDTNFIQVGLWNYKKGKRLETHYHNTFLRESFKTNESVYVIRGKIKCNLYFENGKFISTHIINEGEMIIQFNGAHEYIIEEDALVVENKNGPYYGPEKDRTRI